MNYAAKQNPFIINNIDMQFELQDRRMVYSILEREGIMIPRYAVLDRDSQDTTCKVNYITNWSMLVT